MDLGDTIYSDSRDRRRRRPALHGAEKWAKYRLGLALPASAGCARRPASTPTGTTTSSSTTSRAPSTGRRSTGRREGVHRLRARRVTAGDGLYRTFRWGKNLELFFLDERSFRSAKASRRRAARRHRARPRRQPSARPSGARPVARAARSRRRAWTRSATRRGRCSAAPARALHARRSGPRPRPSRWSSTRCRSAVLRAPYDRWEGYAAERTGCSTRSRRRPERRLPHDRHAREPDRRDPLQTLEPRGPVGTGICEVVTGPVATNTYAQGDRRLPRHGRGSGRRSPRSSSSRRRRTVSACACARPTSTATPGHGHHHDARRSRRRT